MQLLRSYVGRHLSIRFYLNGDLIFLVNYFVLIYTKPHDEIKLQFFSDEEKRQFIQMNGWYSENDL